MHTHTQSPIFSYFFLSDPLFLYWRICSMKAVGPARALLVGPPMCLLTTPKARATQTLWLRKKRTLPLPPVLRDQAGSWQPLPEMWSTHLQGHSACCRSTKEGTESFWNMVRLGPRKPMREARECVLGVSVSHAALGNTLTPALHSTLLFPWVLII